MNIQKKLLRETNEVFFRGCNEQEVKNVMFFMFFKMFH